METCGIILSKYNNVPTAISSDRVESVGEIEYLEAC